MRTKRGFTLIELLVAITILGVLVSVGLGAFSSSQKKARDAKRKSELQSMARALELYYNDYGMYPMGSGGSISNGCGTAFVPSACSWGGVFTKDSVIYMAELPSDPNGTFYYVSDGVSYTLYARLENTDDGAVPTTGSPAAAAAYSGTTCQSGSSKPKCNYGIKSSNSTGFTPVVADNNS